MVSAGFHSLISWLRFWASLIVKLKRRCVEAAQTVWRVAAPRRQRELISFWNPIEVPYIFCKQCDENGKDLRVANFDWKTLRLLRSFSLPVLCLCTRWCGISVITQRYKYLQTICVYQVMYQDCYKPGKSGLTHNRPAMPFGNRKKYFSRSF